MYRDYRRRVVTNDFERYRTTQKEDFLHRNMNDPYFFRKEVKEIKFFYRQTGSW